MIYRIAILDDTQSESDRLRKLVEESLETQELHNYNISVFDSGKEMLADGQKFIFDIYFLDVVMPEMNGIEVGKEIRKRSKDAVIVYITSSREYAFDAYSIRAFHYIEKPVKREAVENVLKDIISLVDKEQDEQISINTNEGIVGVRISNIMYIENVSRRTVYYFDDNSSISSKYNRSTFEESVGDIGNNPGFLHTHKSFYVNLSFVKRMQGENFILDNGKSIPISRNKVNDAKRKYLRYLADGGC